MSPAAAPARRRPRRSPQSFVATKTITVEGEYGEPQRLVAGQTFIHEVNHWLVRTYPDLFVPEAQYCKPQAARSAPSRPAPQTEASPTRRPMWKPLVRLDTRTAPTFTVRLWDKAYDSMIDAV